MANAKIVSMIDHAVVVEREARVGDLEMAFAFLHDELKSLGAKVTELRYDVDELKRERDAKGQ